jgi:hypothetical protein
VPPPDNGVWSDVVQTVACKHEILLLKATAFRNGLKEDFETASSDKETGDANTVDFFYTS